MKTRLTEWEMFELVGRTASGLAGGACGAFVFVLAAFASWISGVSIPDSIEPIALGLLALGGGAVGLFVDLVGWRRRRNRWFTSIGKPPTEKAKGVNV